jgi:hypothetical protein
MIAPRTGRELVFFSFFVIAVILIVWFSFARLRVSKMGTDYLNKSCLEFLELGSCIMMALFHIRVRCVALEAGHLNSKIVAALA